MVACFLFGTALSAAPPRPNVVAVIVDDLGYGDLSCHGSPFVKTPRIDAVHAESVRLVDFHVAPMCSPTRGQLLTGVDAVRNGSTVVAGSRMFVRPEIPMAPKFFAQAGYATGQFCKWHLGENPPHRPQDRGFAESLWFPLQQISSLPDHWDNDYFNPTLRRDDPPAKPCRSPSPMCGSAARPFQSRWRQPTGLQSFPCRWSRDALNWKAGSPTPMATISVPAILRP